MPSRKTVTIPLPGDQLQRMKAALSPQYGYEIWEQEGHKVLVVRVPGEDPDVVNDLEWAVENVNPREVQDLTNCVLVGSVTTTAVSVRPMQELMASRIERDVRVAAELRRIITEVPGYKLYRDPSDPKRIGRLGVSINAGHARDIGDDDLNHLADILGPQLETPAFQNVRGVYIIASNDFVRIDADLFLHDITQRWNDEERHLAAEVREADEPAEQVASDGSASEEVLDGDSFAAMMKHKLAAKPEEPVSVPTAPSWTSSSPPAIRPQAAPSPSYEYSSYKPVEPVTRVATSYTPPAAFSTDDEMRRRIDRMDAGTFTTGTPAAKFDRATDAIPSSYPSYRPSEPTLAPTVTYTPPSLSKVKSILEREGYEVMESPKIPGVQFDLAAEREDGHPRRVLARMVNKLDLDFAEEVLDAVGEIAVDVALIVAPEADQEARDRLIGTKGRWVDASDLDKLSL